MEADPPADAPVGDKKDDSDWEEESSEGNDEDSGSDEDADEGSVTSLQDDEHTYPDEFNLASPPEMKKVKIDKLKGGGEDTSTSLFSFFTYPVPLLCPRRPPPPPLASTTSSSPLKTVKKRLSSLLDIQHCKMVLVVNNSLGMGKGKIAAQCCHAALGAYRLSKRHQSEWLRHWTFCGQAKVALKGDDTEALEIMQAQALSCNLQAYLVSDAGRTQIAPGSKTVLAIGPGPSSEIDAITGSLKLL